MATIKKQSRLQSIINFDDFDIRLFVKYRNELANEVRVWKLPLNSSFLQMFNRKNLIWAIYNKDAKFLHGWFSGDGHFSELMTKKFSSCTDLVEVKKLLHDFEKIIQQQSDK